MHPNCHPPDARARDVVGPRREGHRAGPGRPPTRKRRRALEGRHPQTRSHRRQHLQLDFASSEGVKNFDCFYFGSLSDGEETVLDEWMGDKFSHSAEKRQLVIITQFTDTQGGPLGDGYPIKPASWLIRSF